MDFHHSEIALPLFRRIAEALEEANRGGAMAQMREYEMRASMRKRWPGLKSGNVTSEVLARHMAALGGEPDPGAIRAAFDEFDKSENFELLDAIEIWNCDSTTASALIYFAEALLIISASPHKGQYEWVGGGPKVVLNG